MAPESTFSGIKKNQKHAALTRGCVESEYRKMNLIEDGSSDKNLDLYSLPVVQELAMTSIIRQRTPSSFAVATFGQPPLGLPWMSTYVRTHRFNPCQSQPPIPTCFSPKPTQPVMHRTSFPPIQSRPIPQPNPKSSF